MSMFAQFELKPCPKCGDPDSCMRDQDICSECYSSTPEAIAAMEERRRAEEFDRREMADHVVAGLVSTDIRETDVEHPEFNLRAWERVNAAFDPTQNDWLWLHSRTSGVCKSRIAYMVLRQKLAAILPWSGPGSYNGSLPTVVWVDGDRLVEAFRVRRQWSLGTTANHAQELVDAARTARLLVIDDLTKRKLTSEEASDGLWEVLKHRHEWKLWTVFTDNIPPEAMQDILHAKHAPYLVRRLCERCVEIDFDATPSGSGSSDQSRESPGAS